MSQPARLPLTAALTFHDPTEDLSRRMLLGCGLTKVAIVRLASRSFSVCDSYHVRYINDGHTFPIRRCHSMRLSIRPPSSSRGSARAYYRFRLPSSATLVIFVFYGDNTILTQRADKSPAHMFDFASPGSESYTL